MPIVAADLLFKLSGGAANADPNAALGGAMSATQITTATLANLFDNVSGDESAAGDIEYRCFYVQNNHGTLTLQSAVIWISQLTPSAHTEIAIGLDPAAVGSSGTTIANESTAPAGVSFSAPTTKGAALSIGNMGPGQQKAIWVRRTVNAGAAAVNSDNAIIRIEGDTAA